jgi:hypothetical protein
MRGTRTPRDEAIRRILATLAACPGIRFKPSHLAAHHQIGRERINGLLATLEADGKIARDGQGWFIPSANGELVAPPAPAEPEEGTYVVIAHAGRGVRITLEFAP